MRCAKFALLFLPLWSWASECYFMPPKEWELAAPRFLSSRVKVGFLGKNRTGFCPSLNLAVEEGVEGDIEEYLKCVKKGHEVDAHTRFRDLGNFPTKAGIARLTSLDKKTGGRDARLLQLIFLKDKKAYILTAAASKEEFPFFYGQFKAAFSSFSVTDDLIQEVSDLQKQKKLDQEIALLLQAREGKTPDEFQKSHWLPFQQKVIADFSEMGAYWQLLLLQSINKKVLS